MLLGPDPAVAPKLADCSPEAVFRAPEVRSFAPRIAYYLSEAERIERLAAAAPAGAGRERLEQAAQEYRLLADLLSAARS